MKGKWIGWGAVALGALMAGAGIWMAREFAQAQGLMAALPYVLIGLGCGTFGYGAGAAANAMVARRYPDVARDREIEEKDERNVAIANRAKARALDSMYYVFGALMVALALMGTDMKVILLLVAAYLFVAGSMVYYLCRYQKEM